MKQVYVKPLASGVAFSVNENIAMSLAHVAEDLTFTQDATGCNTVVNLGAGYDVGNCTETPTDDCPHDTQGEHAIYQLIQSGKIEEVIALLVGSKKN